MSRCNLVKILLPLLLLVAPLAQANIGKVIYVAGPVTVERGETLELKKGDMLLEGDIVVTGERARAQLFMMDGARLSIRSNSRVGLDIYRLDGAAAASVATKGAEGQVSLRLIKGGFRTVTGAIGKIDRSDFSLSTPVATLGIRGTDFNTTHCNGDCSPAEPGAPTPPDGTYAGVNSGGVSLSNSLGSVDLDPNQYGYVRDASTPPQQLLTPPVVFNRQQAGSSNETSDDDGDETGGNRNNAGNGENTGGGDNADGGEEGFASARQPSTPPAQDNTSPGNSGNGNGSGQGSEPEQTIVARNEDSGQEIRLDQGRPTDPDSGEPLDPRSGNSGNGNTGGGNSGGDNSGGGNSGGGNSGGGNSGGGNSGGGNSGGGNSGGNSGGGNSGGGNSGGGNSGGGSGTNNSGGDNSGGGNSGGGSGTDNSGGGNSGGGSGTDNSGGGNTGSGFREPYQPADNDNQFSGIGGNKNDFNDGVLDNDVTGSNGVGSAYNAAVSLEDYGTAQAPAELFGGLTAAGSDTDTGLNWGRWASGFNRAPADAHYVSDALVDRAVVLPTTGTLDYSLRGGTAPTDSAGNTGTLNSGSLSADFVNMKVTNQINLTIGSETWNAVGEGQIDTGAPVFNGSYDVTRGASPTPNGTGNFSGFFGGVPLPSGAPSGAGVGYSLESGGVTVNGAAAFKAN